MKIVRIVVAVAGVGVLVSACGSASPTGTSTTTKSFQSAVSQAYKYAACMREHGVTNFPDPKVVNNGNQQAIGIKAVGPSTPGFQTAQKACSGILPTPSKADLAAQAAAQRAHGQDLLSFARCMRGRGINGFPDPGAQGQLPIQMITAAGIDLHAPQVAAAARACLPAAHGAITRADVAQATGSGG